MAGLVLLVAMIGAIVLTLRHKPTRRQAPERSPSRTLRTRGGPWSKFVKVTRGGGDLMMMSIGLGHYLTVAAILFTIGIFGIFLNRKNVIIILMSVELMLLSVNINFVAFSTVSQ
jgi:hypothetical protein